MRPAPYHRDSRPPAENPGTPAAPTSIAAQTATCSADASSDLAAQIAQARHDARRHPEQAAMLLRSWMAKHG
jgi:hypothetical protein